MTEKQHRSTRRNFLKGAFALTGALALGGISARLWRNHVGRDFDPDRTEELLDQIQSASSIENLPNIIVILVDDLGFGDWLVDCGNV